MPPPLRRCQCHFAPPEILSGARLPSEAARLFSSAS
jgi:hypothetical protein